MMEFSEHYNADVVDKTISFVKEKLSGEGSGHDWWHIYRVYVNAKRICKQEQANIYVVELAALLHDIADWKFNDGNEDIGPQIATEWLDSLNVSAEIIREVCLIIRNLSFKGANVSVSFLSLEGQIVQDADRLDAIGAIGIARAFAYGGYKNREIHNPFIPPELHDSFSKYKNNNSPTINHFYEKLLFLKDRMNTQTAKKIALKRHDFMKTYLAHFLDEWDANDLIITDEIQ